MRWTVGGDVGPHRVWHPQPMERGDPAATTTKAAGGAVDPLARHSLSAAELKRMLAAERSGEAFLATRDGDGELSLVLLDPRATTVTLGRHSGMDMPIDWDAEVSGVHAELRRLGGEWTVADDGLSRNGTFLNGERVGGRQRLRSGDRLRLGRTIIAFCGDATEASEATVASGELPELPSLTDTQRRILVALCRPYMAPGEFRVPASNQQIADEVFLGVDAVKRHLRALFQRFGLGELPQNQKRARLAELALKVGIVSQRDFIGG